MDTSNAADYFTQVLALPENEQRVYGLAAQYSLGRALMDDYITDSQESSLCLGLILLTTLSPTCASRIPKSDRSR